MKTFLLAWAKAKIWQRSWSLVSVRSRSGRGWVRAFDAGFKRGLDFAPGPLYIALDRA